MKDEFPGYFRPTEGQIKKLWEDALFVFDTSFLLNLYRYSKDTRSEVIKILRGIEKQLWSPHQAAIEFLRNRFVVFDEQQRTYDAANKDLTETEDDFKATRRHPFLSDPLLKQMSALAASH